MPYPQRAAARAAQNAVAAAAAAAAASPPRDAASVVGDNFECRAARHRDTERTNRMMMRHAFELLQESLPTPPDRILPITRLDLCLYTVAYIQVLRRKILQLEDALRLPRSSFPPELPHAPADAMLPSGSSSVNNKKEPTATEEAEAAVDVRLQQIFSWTARKQVADAADHLRTGSDSPAKRRRHGEGEDGGGGAQPRHYAASASGAGHDVGSSAIEYPAFGGDVRAHAGVAGMGHDIMGSLSALAAQALEGVDDGVLLSLRLAGSRPLVSPQGGVSQLLPPSRASGADATPGAAAYVQQHGGMHIRAPHDVEGSSATNTADVDMSCRTPASGVSARACSMTDAPASSSTTSSVTPIPTLRLPSSTSGGSLHHSLQGLHAAGYNVAALQPGGVASSMQQRPHGRMLLMPTPALPHAHASLIPPGFEHHSQQPPLSGGSNGAWVDVMPLNSARSTPRSGSSGTPTVQLARAPSVGSLMTASYSSSVGGMGGGFAMPSHNGGGPSPAAALLHHHAISPPWNMDAMLHAGHHTPRAAVLSPSAYTARGGSSGGGSGSGAGAQGMAHVSTALYSGSAAVMSPSGMWHPAQHTAPHMTQQHAMYYSSGDPSGGMMSNVPMLPSPGYAYPSGDQQQHAVVDERSAAGQRRQVVAATPSTSMSTHDIAPTLTVLHSKAVAYAPEPGDAASGVVPEGPASAAQVSTSVENTDVPASGMKRPRANT